MSKELDKCKPGGVSRFVVFGIFCSIFWKLRIRCSKHLQLDHFEKMYILYILYI